MTIAYAIVIAAGFFSFVSGIQPRVTETADGKKIDILPRGEWFVKWPLVGCFGLTMASAIKHFLDGDFILTAGLFAFMCILALMLELKLKFTIPFWDRVWWIATGTIFMLIGGYLEWNHLALLFS